MSTLLLGLILTVCFGLRVTAGQGVYLSLKGVNYTNNSFILITEIDQTTSTTSNNGLQCITDRRPCCTGADKAGEWFFPDNPGGMVPVLLSGTTMATTFYRNRGIDGKVNLNRVNTGVMMPTGMFCCVVPDATDVDQTLCANIVLILPTAMPPSMTTTTSEFVSPTTMPPSMTTPTNARPESPVTTSSSDSTPTGVYLSLKGMNYTNNSFILITEIEQTNDTSNNGLQCITDRRPCCAAAVGRAGEWFFPDNGGMVLIQTGATTFYRTRGDDGTVTLNRVNTDVMMPTGRFCCVVPDATSTSVTLCANIVLELPTTVLYSITTTNAPPEPESPSTTSSSGSIPTAIALGVVIILVVLIAVVVVVVLVFVILRLRHQQAVTKPVEASKQLQDLSFSSNIAYGQVKVESTAPDVYEDLSGCGAPLYATAEEDDIRIHQKT